MPILFVAFALVVGCDNPLQPGRPEAVTSTQNDPLDERRSGTIVSVAPPTGDPAEDVPAIQAAVAAATPGVTIEFAPGSYAMDATTQIVVSVPGVTLQGHRRGTTIVGVPGSPPDFLSGDFLLSGGHQTVSRLNFEGFSLALSFGDPGTTVGGYRLEDCTFRNGDQPFDFVGFSDEVSVVRNNRFINVTLAFVMLGKTVHFVGNSITAPQPELAGAGRPLFAGIVLPEFLSGINICEDNLIAQNRVAGISDGFLFVAFGEERCRKNTVRGNRFRDQVVVDASDSGTLLGAVGPGVQDNLIANNELRGSEGVGIVISEGSGNRILGNEIRDLPGLEEVFTGFPGTGILLGEGTTGNRVLKNEFRNVVQAIVDLGSENIIGRGQRDIEDDHQHHAEMAESAQLSASAVRSSRLAEKLQRWLLKVPD